MTTEQKGQQTADNQSGQKQQQGNHFKQDSPTKSDTPTSKPTTRIEDDEEQTDVTKREQQGKNHPHDPKTPVAEQKFPDQNQGKSLTEARDASKNQNSTQRSEQKS